MSFIKSSKSFLIKNSCQEDKKPFPKLSSIREERDENETKVRFIEPIEESFSSLNRLSPKFERNIKHGFSYEDFNDRKQIYSIPIFSENTENFKKEIGFENSNNSYPASFSNETSSNSNETNAYQSSDLLQNPSYLDSTSYSFSSNSISKSSSSSSSSYAISSNEKFEFDSIEKSKEKVSSSEIDNGFSNKKKLEFCSKIMTKLYCEDVRHFELKVPVKTTEPAVIILKVKKSQEAKDIMAKKVDKINQKSKIYELRIKQEANKYFLPPVPIVRDRIPINRLKSASTLVRSKISSFGKSPIKFSLPVVSEPNNEINSKLVESKKKNIDTLLISTLFNQPDFENSKALIRENKSTSDLNKFFSDKKICRNLSFIKTPIQYSNFGSSTSFSSQNTLVKKFCHKFDAIIY